MKLTDSMKMGEDHMRTLLCVTDLSTHPSFDTTVALYTYWAAKPTIRLYHANANEISNSHSVSAHLVEGALSYDDFLNIEASKRQVKAISDFDLVFLRTDKPYPTGLLETCSTWEDNVAFVNLASATLAIETRVFLHEIAQGFLPTAIVTADVEEALEFGGARTRFIVKKNRSYGGKGVYLVQQEDACVIVRNVMSDDRSFRDIRAALTHIWQQDEAPFEVCEYLAKASEGDKRHTSC
jgi:glutathione synthase